MRTNPVLGWWVKRVRLCPLICRIDVVQSLLGERHTMQWSSSTGRRWSLGRGESCPASTRCHLYGRKWSVLPGCWLHSDKDRSQVRNRNRSPSDRCSTRSRSPLGSSQSGYKPTPSRYLLSKECHIGDRDPLCLEVRGGDWRVSLPDRNSRHKDQPRGRKHSISRSRTPSRTNSTPCRTSKSTQSHQERRSYSAPPGERVSDDDGLDVMVSWSRYSMLWNAVRTCKGPFTSVNPRGEGMAKASMVPLCQDDKPQKLA